MTVNQSLRYVALSDAHAILSTARINCASGAMTVYAMVSRAQRLVQDEMDQIASKVLDDPRGYCDECKQEDENINEHDCPALEGVRVNPQYGCDGSRN